MEGNDKVNICKPTIFKYEDLATEPMSYAIRNGKKISECKLYMSDSTLAELDKQKPDIPVINKENIDKKYSEGGYIMPSEGIPVFIDNELNFGEVEIK